MEFLQNVGQSFGKSRLIKSAKLMQLRGSPRKRRLPEQICLPCQCRKLGNGMTVEFMHLGWHAAGSRCVSPASRNAASLDVTDKIERPFILIGRS